jgi:hypothetical protein
MKSIQYRIWMERAGILPVLEETESNHATHFLFHPIRGMYKLEKERDKHHLFNDEGEVSHTFVGNSEEEIMQILKNEHGFIRAGKMNEELLTELRAPKAALTDEQKQHEKDYAKASSSINDARGKYNEAIVLHHLNGNKWINSEHRKLAEEKGKILSDHDDKWNKAAKKVKHPTFVSNTKKEQDDRAPVQAKSFLEHAKKMGYEGVQSVHHTSKEGDIERSTGLKVTQQENPSDGVVTFKKKPAKAKHPHLGISLKSSASKAVGFHNGGTKEIGKLIGHDLHGEADKMQKDYMEKNELGNVKTKAQKIIKGEKYSDATEKKENPKYKNNEAYRAAGEHAKTINTAVRDKLHEGYSNMHHEALREHLLKTYIKGNTEHALPYVKTSGSGGGHKPSSAHTEDPSDNDMYHQIKKAHKIELHKTGEGAIAVHTVDKDGNSRRAFGIQVKHSDGPLSTMKIGAAP